MKEYACSKERFLDDVKDHELTIIKDDGLYRHIRMSRKGSSYYRYDIVTTSYHLFVVGDMGTWVFSRIKDMFAFFIMGDNDFNKENIINPYYWSQKLQASKDGYEEFSHKKMKNIIREYQERWCEIIEEEVDEKMIDKAKDELDEFISDTFNNMSCYSEHEVYNLLENFEFHLDNNIIFRFDGWYEGDRKEYTFHYIWICYAIVYAIIKYNEVKGELK